MPPEAGAKPDTNFDSIWSMVFTLEPTLTKKKEIWFVQDKDENRTSSIINLLEIDEDQSSINNNYVSKDLIKLLAWAGGLWFFIVHMFMKPVISHFVHRKLPEKYHNAGNEIFFGASQG